jgi:hypothetical protein
MRPLPHVPESAWLDGIHPFLNELYRVSNPVDRLRRDVAVAFHEGLPSSVALALVDELLNAEALGHLVPLQIASQVDPAIATVIRAVESLALPHRSPDGSIRHLIPTHRLSEILP